MTKKKHVTPDGPSRLERGMREAVLLSCAALTAFLLLALLSWSPNDPGWSSSGSGDGVQNLCGVFGAWVADILLSLFGYVAFALPWLILLGGFIHYRASIGKLAWSDSWPVRLIASILLPLAACGLAAAHSVGNATALPQGSGGILGTVIGQELTQLMGGVGSTLVLLTIIIVALPLSLAFSWLATMDWIGERVLRGVDAARTRWEAFQEQRAIKKAEDEERRARESLHAIRTAPETDESDSKPGPILPEVTQAAAATVKKITRRAKKKPARPDSNGKTPAAQLALPIGSDEQGVDVPPFDGDPLPPTEMLDPPRAAKIAYTQEELDVMSREVEDRLGDFGVSVKVIAAHPGPVITRFEIEPAPGVKGSQIANLSKDLARALSAVAVRVVEVIPGKSYIGLEIPNKNRELVSMRAMLENNKFTASESTLTMALGKDIGGHSVVANLGKMPHLLVAGTTGSGKSVAVNVMICSMLYKATAEDVRFIMVDPKMLELSVYDGIPHLLAPVVTDMKEAANALRWSVGEMERRYKLMAAMGVRNLAGANTKILAAIEAGEPLPDPLYDPETAFDPEQPAPTLEKIPHIVIIIDELADMMMVVGKKCEELIARLAQKARAAGIHLILATQRPSVDVITGLIKANIPTRIAFQVSSRIDSRTILDQQGAESLLGHGDMLYLPPGTSVPTRVHGAFVDDHEVHKIVGYLKQVGEPVYEDGVLEGGLSAETALPGETAPGGEDPEGDPLYDQAVAIVVESRKASISYVQRRLQVGYNRAARMIEAMEASGVIGPQEGSGKRAVLAPPPPK